MVRGNRQGAPLRNNHPPAGGSIGEILLSDAVSFEKTAGRFFKAQLYMAAGNTLP